MYELDGHRFRELKHFCMQYDYMKESLLKMEAIPLEGYDPTARSGILRTEYRNAVKLIEMTAKETDLFLWDKVLEVVTRDIPTWKMVNPCTRACMEELRRKFYWLLSNRKGY